MVDIINHNKFYEYLFIVPIPERFISILCYAGNLFGRNLLLAPVRY